MPSELEKLTRAKSFLQGKCKNFPRLCVVLGSGLGNVVEEMEKEVELPLSEIPGVRPPSVEGHSGKLVIGKLHGVRIAVQMGRLHYYEGIPMNDVVFPARAFAWAGAKGFLLTNAAGGLRKELVPLDFLLIRDHINLMGTNPLIGPNISELGPRFPDMTHLYDPALTEILRVGARMSGVNVHEGIYVGIHGPSYETPAEIRMYRSLGADAVGMSTVPESIALHHMGRRVVGLSCITNLAAGVSPEPLVHSDVLNNAKKIQGRFSALLKASLPKLEQALG